MLAEHPDPQPCSIADWRRRSGLVYVDAHGDYNTPETSPSGMLGGMPAAVAAGKCLHRLRYQNMLREPASTQP